MGRDIQTYQYKNSKISLYYDEEESRVFYCLKDIERTAKIKSSTYRIQKFFKNKIINQKSFIKYLSIPKQEISCVKFINDELLTELMNFSSMEDEDKSDFSDWLYVARNAVENKFYGTDEIRLLQRQNEIMGEMHEKIFHFEQNIKKENNENNEELKKKIIELEKKIKEITKEKENLENENKSLGYLELGESQEMSDLRVQLEDKEREIQPLKEQIERLSKQNAEIYVAYRCCCHSREQFEYKFKCLQEMYERNTGKKLEEDFYL